MTRIEFDHADRRTETRYALGGRIEWRRPDDLVMGKGWIVDQSDRGVAFITAASLTPVTGEPITIFPRAEHLHAQCGATVRICRVTPYDARLSLVACVTDE
jgi:hypothetical protein